ncbi:hypothetical protein L7F22_057334 [Adiantum nelumboides]|nr:hypothetical protein [Adiantum nelumboides]
MKQFLSSNAKDKVLTEWQSLKLTPYDSIHKYVDKFWDLHLKATVYKKIDFEEQKQQLCAGLPEDMNEYVNSQRPKSISAIIHHTMVAARINSQQGAKRNLKSMEMKEKHEPKGKDYPQNSSKGNSSNNKAKEKGVHKGKSLRVVHLCPRPSPYGLCACYGVCVSCEFIVFGLLSMKYSKLDLFLHRPRALMKQMKRPASSLLRSFSRKACNSSGLPNAPLVCKTASSEVVSSPSRVSRLQGAMVCLQSLQPLQAAMAQVSFVSRLSLGSQDPVLVLQGHFFSAQVGCYCLSIDMERR